MEKYNVIISEDAINLLDSHAEFMARVNKNAARKLVDSVLEDIESLSELPERCPVYDNEFVPRGRYRQFLSCKRYLIIFEIADATVYVDFILDCRKDNNEFGIQSQ